MMPKVFTCACWSFVYLLWTNVCSNSLLIFNLDFCLFVVKCFTYPEYWTLLKYMTVNIFSHSLGCLLTFLIVSFDVKFLMKSNYLFFLLLFVLLVSKLKSTLEPSNLFLCLQSSFPVHHMPCFFICFRSLHNYNPSIFTLFIIGTLP